MVRREFARGLVAVFSSALLVAVLIPLAQSALRIDLPTRPLPVSLAQEAPIEVAETLAGALNPQAFAPVVTRAAGAPLPDVALISPSGLTVFQDDRNAILEWDVDPKNPVRPLPDGVAGYRVTWGPAGQPDAFTRLTEERIIQLQPLVNGQQYTARVQTVDIYGRLSGFSAPISFTGDPRRVDALRARMNGFFDDFNLPAGPVDERKWNYANSLCNEPARNGFFINDQFHVHNAVSSGGCDRSQSISRPRAQLDFTDNGTRTIVFDFDGQFRRDQWYVDLVPRLMDISGQVSLEAGETARADPSYGLRFHQNGQGLTILWFTAQGGEKTLARTDFQPYPSLDWAGLKQVPNVRRRWEIKVSRSSAEIFINGTKVLATQPGAFNLTEPRYTVMWNTFSYNTPKSNEPLVLVHWDNFGFDAPAGSRPTTVTHNYRLINSGTDVVRAFNSAPAPVTLRIPDSVTGAAARRLMFTLQMLPYDTYAWAPTDKVTVNGQDFAIPRPTSSATPPLPESELVSVIAPYTVVIPLPEGALRTGANSIVFSAKFSTLNNIHVELDFPIGAAPSYTQPAQLLSGSVTPTLPSIGPNAIISRVGDTVVETWRDGVNTPAVFNRRVSGVTPVAVEVHSEMAMNGGGSNPGIVQVELLVDGRVVQAIRTDAQAPAPSVRHTFMLDTRQIPNGQRQIFVRAYSPSCVASIADYQGAGPGAGTYFPLHITVSGSGASALPPAVDLSGMPCQAAKEDFVMDHNH